MGRAQYAIRAALFGAVLGISATAAAQVTFPPITNRNFNIDLFEQPAIGFAAADRDGGGGRRGGGRSGRSLHESRLGGGAAGNHRATSSPGTSTSILTFPSTGKTPTTTARPSPASIVLCWAPSACCCNTGRGVCPSTADIRRTRSRRRPAAGWRPLVHRPHRALARTFSIRRSLPAWACAAAALNVYTLDPTGQTLFTRVGVSGDGRRGLDAARAETFVSRVSGGYRSTRRPSTSAAIPITAPATSCHQRDRPLGRHARRRMALRADALESTGSRATIGTSAS